MNDNYFKEAETGELHWFNEASVASVFSQVSDLKLSVYKPTRRPGVWDRLPLIGHRERNEILRDLGRVRSEETKKQLHDELDSLTARYLDVGRFSLPLALAAA